MPDPELTSRREMRQEHGDELMRHVLVCLDRSPLAERALGHGLAIADALGAEVTVLHVMETPGRTEFEAPDPVAWDMRRLEAGAYLERVAERASAGRMAVARELGEGDPALQIRCWVAEHAADLVVVSSHGEKGRTDWPLASTARKLVESLPCSVLVVPVHEHEPAPERPRYARIMAPLDGSSWSETALQVAVRVAEAHGAEIMLAHAVPAAALTRIRPPTAEDLELEQRVLERNERVAREYLEQLRARLAAGGLRVRVLVTQGYSVRDELVGMTEREAPDLVVVSACGSSGRPERPSGSVASHLLSYVTRPLLLLRPPHAARTQSIADSRVQAASRLPQQASL